jgi:hypothetical protein
MFTSIPTPGKRTEGREGREDSNTVCMDLANIREKNNTEYSTREYMTGGKVEVSTGTGINYYTESKRKMRAGKR